MATRCMLSAEYFCSGSVSKDTFGHYGLASEIYTHFTSPIRRYAGTYLPHAFAPISLFHLRFCEAYVILTIESSDVLVHRQLSAAISHTSPHASLLSKTSVDRVMENINKRHRMAQMAGRASVEFYVGLALKARGEKSKSDTTKMVVEGGGVEEDAFVIRVFKNGVGVFVSAYACLSYELFVCLLMNGCRGTGWELRALSSLRKTSHSMKITTR